MIKYICCIITLFCLSACQNTATDQVPASATQPPMPIALQDISTYNIFPVNCSIRALEVIDDNHVWFAGSAGQYGYTQNAGVNWTLGTIQTDSIVPNFRAIAHTSEAVFLLSIESPALLYRSTDNGTNWDIVYREDHPKAFYDAMVFWDDKEGIAMGDPTDGCLSVIITRDGGKNWQKLSCDQLPPAAEGEAAFAASNSNIAVQGDHAWIVSGGKKSRIFHSPDRGHSWEVYDSPIIQGGTMTGIFSCDFYDENTGIVIGGDWENQGSNVKNKATTNDGGKTWQLVSDGQTPGYRSSVRYRPQSQGQHILAVGIPGISFSADAGQNWTDFSDESFYTVRFGSNKNGANAWMAGRNKVAKIFFSYHPAETKKVLYPYMGAKTNKSNSFQKIVDDHKLTGSILVYDSKNNTFYSNNFQRCFQHFLPASTFKIPNSMIMLETGVVEDENTLLKWNGEERRRKNLQRDMTFKEAFQDSCLPCYQEMTKELGYTKMKAQLKKLDYGLMDFDSSDVHQFWVEGNSAITQYQQIDFLKRFYNKELPVADRTHNIVKDMMRMEENKLYTLYGKTGWAVYDEVNLGWFVGIAETADNVYYVATNIEPGSGFDMKQFYKTRIQISREALELIIP